MKKPVLPVLFLSLALPLLSFAQTTAVVTDITFDFYVGKELMRAGTYKFNLSSNKPTISLSNANGGQSIMIPVLTRISQRDLPTQLVFDKAEDRYYLAELHVRGIDGYHFAGAPGPHTHVTVTPKK